MTAHDPRVTLTEVLASHDDPEGWYCDDNDDLRYQCNCGESSPALARDGEGIEPRHCIQAADWHRAHVAEVIETTVIAARLAPIRALIADFDGWEIDEIDVPWVEVGRLRKALDAPQDAPCGPVGGEQGAEVAR